MSSTTVVIFLCWVLSFDSWLIKEMEHVSSVRDCAQVRKGCFQKKYDFDIRSGTPDDFLIEFDTDKS